VLRAAGLHVVEVGELEGFVRTVGGHGPRWVNEVLKRDLASDPELEARGNLFVSFPALLSLEEVKHSADRARSSDGAALPCPAEFISNHSAQGGLKGFLLLVYEAA
jgi:hypothetical protein